MPARKVRRCRAVAARVTTDTRYKVAPALNLLRARLGQGTRVHNEPSVAANSLSPGLGVFRMPERVLFLVEPAGKESWSRVGAHQPQDDRGGEENGQSCRKVPGRIHGWSIRWHSQFGGHFGGQPGAIRVRGRPYDAGSTPAASTKPNQVSSSAEASISRDSPDYHHIHRPRDPG